MGLLDELTAEVRRSWPLPLWLAAGAVMAFVVQRTVCALLARRAPTEPRCRGCGYPTRGLPGHVCPECGNDLRGAGTAWPYAPEPRRILSLPRRATALTLLFVVWWPVASHVIPPYAPRWERVQTSGPLYVVAEGLHPLPLRAREMYLEVWNPVDQHPRRAQRMTIRPDSLGYGYWRSTGERVERPSGLNEAVIRDLMETMSVPISGREAEAIMRDVQESRSIVYHAYDDDSRAARTRASLLWWTLWFACIAAVTFRVARHTRRAALAIPAASVTN